MHLPPAASWVPGTARGGPKGLVLALLALNSALVALFCLLQPWGMGPLLLLSSLVIAATCAWWGLRHGPRGLLRWDGQAWYWRSGEKEQTIREMNWVLDWQRLLLVRIRCADERPLWLWLQSAEMDTPWLALRRALVAQGQKAHRPRVSLPE